MTQVIWNILIYAGIGIIIYGAYGVFSARPTQGRGKPRRKLDQQPIVGPDDGHKDRKIQDLKTQIASLENVVADLRAEVQVKRNEAEKAVAQFTEIEAEISRRQEWVGKGEEMLTKAKEESQDFKSKFIAKGKEIEQEFARNVELKKQVDEAARAYKIVSDEKKQIEEQAQIQKYQIEKMVQEIKIYKSTVGELQRKDKVTEWVPKTEFVKLNEEFSDMEKEFEAQGEKLRVFSEEITHLKGLLEHRAQVSELRQEVLPQVENVASEEMSLPEDIAQESSPVVLDLAPLLVVEELKREVAMPEPIVEPIKGETSAQVVPTVSESGKVVEQADIEVKSEPAQAIIPPEVPAVDVSPPVDKPEEKNV